MLVQLAAQFFVLMALKLFLIIILKFLKNKKININAVVSRIVIGPLYLKQFLQPSAF